MQRHKQILAVAAELFARQGFHGTTTRQIAEQAQVNEAILFRHLNSGQRKLNGQADEGAPHPLIRFAKRSADSQAPLPKGVGNRQVSSDGVWIGPVAITFRPAFPISVRKLAPIWGFIP